MQAVIPVKTPGKKEKQSVKWNGISASDFYQFFSVRTNENENHPSSEILSGCEPLVTILLFRFVQHILTDIVI